MKNVDNWFMDSKREKLGKRIKEERLNFFFLTDGSMVYDCEHFDGYYDALIDAIEKGEDMDEMIALVFPEEVDHPIVKKKLTAVIYGPGYMWKYNGIKKQVVKTKI